MPRPRFFNLPVKDRRQLLTVATRHFARDGFEGASLNAILAEAGLSKGSFYYYFEDKEDLYAAALESGFDEILGRMPVPELYALTTDTFWPEVERVVREWALAFDTSSDLFRAALHFTEEQRKSPRFAPMIAREEAMRRALIEAGQRLGCVRSDLPVDVLVRLIGANDAALDAIFLSLPGGYGPETLERHLSVAFDTVKRLLVVDPFGTPQPTSRRRGAAEAGARRSLSKTNAASKAPAKPNAASKAFAKTNGAKKAFAKAKPARKIPSSAKAASDASVQDKRPTGKAAAERARRRRRRG